MADPYSNNNDYCGSLLYVKLNNLPCPTYLIWFNSDCRHDFADFTRFCDLCHFVFNKRKWRQLVHKAIILGPTSPNISAQCVLNPTSVTEVTPKSQDEPEKNLQSKTNKKLPFLLNDKLTVTPFSTIELIV